MYIDCLSVKPTSTNLVSEVLTNQDIFCSKITFVLKKHNMTIHTMYMHNYYI